MIVLFVFLSLFAILLLLWQISNIASVFFGSPYVKTNRRIIIKALKLAGLKKNEIFYDLGSGNGDAIVEATKLGAKATGFEISPFYYFWGKLRTWRDSRIKIKFQNINNIDLNKADVVYCYLLPKFLEKLIPKFKKELKPGSRLISIGFPIKNTTFSTPASKVGNYTIQNRKVYIYKF